MRNLQRCVGVDNPPSSGQTIGDYYECEDIVLLKWNAHTCV